ncbi:hypothetical protein H311_03002 [Anncaliia algerae PRA109]|uniref:Small GTP-binding protein domain n=1 Tax=Anncaliia algerae PRA339 TaxID=1288291 RepID=A0A059F318_9MICR|nr:hypothetical protein H311_03002 [Anncaliia algerae PRA109]KCZ81404.1 hypothetical protein H312_01159 [Anncaliia algerae PRA339]
MDTKNISNYVEEYNYIFKIVLVGDSGVGKTNLLSRLTKQEFSATLPSTIGVEFATVTFKMDEDNVKAQIWDTAGQERYRAITSAYYRGTYGALIVFDLTQRKTLTQSINHWLIQLREFSRKDMIIILIGNKSDLTEQREVTKEEANKIADENGMVYFETSALSGDNVNKSFYELVRKIYDANKIVTLPEAKKKLSYKEKEMQRVIIKKNQKKRGCC